MKNIFTFIALFAFSVIGLSQEVYFFEGLETFKYGDNKAKTLIEFKANRPDYKLAGGSFQVLDSISILENGKTKRTAFEYLQFVNEKENLLVEFYYLDDMLYGKNIAYYFESNDVKNAQKLFNHITDSLAVSPYLSHFRNQGPVYFEKHQLAAGEYNYYPIKRIHNDVYEGKVGMVWNVEDIHKLNDLNNKGIWVYITLVNTFEIPLKAKFRFPTPMVPYATIEELSNKQIEIAPSVDAPEVMEVDEVEEKEEIEIAPETESEEPGK